MWDHSHAVEGIRNRNVEHISPHRQIAIPHPWVWQAPALLTAEVATRSPTPGRQRPGGRAAACTAGCTTRPSASRWSGSACTEWGQKSLVCLFVCATAHGLVGALCLRKSEARNNNVPEMGHFTEDVSHANKMEKKTPSKTPNKMGGQ